MWMKFTFRVILVSYGLMSLVHSEQASAIQGFDVSEISKEMSKFCVSMSGDSELVECLNEKVQSFVQEKLEPSFRVGLQEKARRYDINDFQEHLIPPLWQLYPVQIPLVNESQEPQMCVDFKPKKSVSRRAKIQSKAKALVRAALFARRYALNSFGRPFSPLLGFSEVHVCDHSFLRRQLYLDREQKVLKMATSNKQGQELSANALYEEWTLGNAVNPRPHRWTPLIDRIPKAGFLTLDRREHIDYFLYINWDKVNPVGPLRITLRAAALNISHQLAQRFKADAEATTLLSTEMGFEDAWDGANKDLHKDLAHRLVQRLVDPWWVGKVVSKHLAVSARLCRGARARTTTGREQRGFFNFMNNKTFAIDVGFEVPFVAFEEVTGSVFDETDAFCASSELEVKETQWGVYNISLIDNLALSVSGLGQLTDVLLLMPQMALYEALRESVFQAKPD